MIENNNKDTEYEKFVEEVTSKVSNQYNKMEKAVLKDAVEAILYLLGNFRLGCLLKMIVEVNEAVSFSNDDNE